MSTEIKGLLIIVAIIVLIAVVVGSVVLILNLLDKFRESKKWSRYQACGYIEQIVANVVRFVNQVYVEDAKSENEDGKLDTAQKRNVLEIAKKTVTHILDDKFIEQLSGYIGNFDQYIEVLIESTVNDINNNEKNRAILDMTAPLIPIETIESGDSEISDDESESKLAKFDNGNNDTVSPKE